MEFYGGLGGAETRPRKQTQTQIDGGRIQRIESVGQLQSQGFVGIQEAGPADESGSQVGVDAPVARTVGIGQRAMRHRRAKPQVIELFPAGAQADF